MSRAGFSIKPRKYVPKCSMSEANPPIFTIRRLSPLELMDITAEFTDENETIELGGIATDSPDKKEGFKVSIKTVNKLVKSRFAVLKAALSGWERVEDEDGAPIPFSAENIPCLDPDIINELSEVAQGTIGKEEVKNSSTPSE